MTAMLRWTCPTCGEVVTGRGPLIEHYCWSSSQGVPPAPRPSTTSARYRSALQGRLPAEALSTVDREALLADLAARGWSVTEIAVHTRESDYTVARILDRIGVTAGKQVA